MKRRLLAFVLVLAMLLSVTPVAVFAAETPDVTISTLAELKEFRNNVNGGNSYSGKTVVLAANIDLGGEEWTPIGNSTNKFLGKFDGQGHTISNLVITGNKGYVGLFGYIGGGSMSATAIPTVKDLNLRGVNVSGDYYVGALAGQAYVCNITNVHVQGTVTGTRYVGGLVGHVYTYFKDCSFIGNASCTFDALGGIAGAGDCRAYDCKVIGDITGSNWVGGIVGNGQEGTSAVGCYVEGTVSSDTNYYRGVGGIAGVAGHGYNGSVFQNNYFNGEVYLCGEKVDAIIMGIVNAADNAAIKTTVEGNSWNTKYYSANTPVYVVADISSPNATAEEWVNGASEEKSSVRNNNLVMLQSDIPFIDEDAAITFMNGANVTVEDIEYAFAQPFRYVSIGDSMSNGYCFEGYRQGEDTNYNFFNGEGVYGADAYPLQFETYLKSKGYVVDHIKLASSAMRAEDLLYLLGGRDKPTDGWFDQINHYTNCDDDAVLSAHFTQAITDADIMTMCIGNASFGAYLVQAVTRALGVMGGSLAEDEKVDLADALALVENDDLKQTVLKIYDSLKAEMNPYLGVVPFESEEVEDVLGILTYTAASFLVNYEALIDRIAELNPDAEIVLIGLMNTTYGMTITGDGFEFPFGDMMDQLFSALNAYIAGVPAVKHLAGECEGITFYYADQPQPQFIVQAFDDLAEAGWQNVDKGRLSADIVRQRSLKAYNNNLRPMISAALNDGDMDALPVVTLEDLEEYVIGDTPIISFPDTPYENYDSYGDYALGTPTPEYIAKYISVACYLAVEEAVVKNVDTMEITIDGLMGIAGDIFAALGDMPPELAQNPGPWTIKTTLVNWFTSSATGNAMCKVYGLFKIGDGMSVHPTPTGHDNMAKAVIEAYGNGYTAEDETKANLETYIPAAYAKAYQYAKENGYIDQAKAYVSLANGAVATANFFVNNITVPTDMEQTKVLLLAELNNTSTTLAKIQMLLDISELTPETWALILTMEHEITAHMNTLSALANELGIVGNIALDQIAIVANHYSAMIDTMVNNAYAWVINGVVEFNAEYLALVDKTGALADQVDPALGAAVRKFMIEAPADTLAILYAYGEEAAINLFIAAADAADEIYVAATALASVMKDHGVDIYRAIMNDLTCQQLRQQLIALNDQLLALEAQAKNAPMSTALALYEQIDAIKDQAILLAGQFYDAAIAAVTAADPTVALALDDAFQAFLKAVGTVGEAADGYAAWLPGHANAMAGELLTALLANWNEFTGVACPIVTEIVAQILTDLNEYVEGVIGEVENQVRYQLSVLDAELTKLKEQLLTAAGEAKEQILAQIAVLEAKINELHTILAEGIVKNFARAAQLLEEIKNDVIALANAAKDAALTEAYNALTAIFGNLAKLDELVKNAIGEKYEEFKAQVGAFATTILDRIFEAAARIAPELDAELYAFFYNNPDKVIAFFEEYGDEIAALGAEYGDEAIGTIGIALFLYGEDLAEYLIENREAVLEGIMNWADKYGERTVAMVQVYAEALGLCDAVRSEIAKLEDKIAALEAQLSYQIKVLDEQLNVELTKLNAQLAELYAQLENAVEEQKAIIEAKIAEVKALIAQVEAQIEQIKVLIAEIQQKLSEAQALLTEMYGKLQNLVDALYNLDDALKYLLNAGVEAATPVIQQALDAVADAVRELVGVVSAETAEQLDKIINEAKAFLDRAFYDATHANYHIDADSAYVALGDNKMVAQFFADYLKEYVAKEGVNYKYSTTDLTVENSVISDLSLIIAENMEVIASADLISLGYSYDAIAEETLTILIDLLIEGTTDAVGEYDWVALVGDEAAAEIEAYLADLYDTMVAQGFGVTVSEMIGFPVESNVTIADAAAIAVEHFAYNAVEYAVLLPQTVLAIQAINPNALVMIHAVSNPLAGASVSLLGEEFIFGDYIDYIVDATNVESVIFAAVTDNVVFVPATKVVTNCTDSAIIRVNSLNDVIELMYAYKAGDLICIDPTDEGNAYVADKMAETLTITVEYVGGLLGDANNDGVVNSIDAAMILQYDVNMVDADMIYLAVCDVNGDGDVNSIDAAMILQFDVGSLEQFPAAVH